jgi:hypothetical protein
MHLLAIVSPLVNGQRVYRGPRGVLLQNTRVSPSKLVAA